MIELYLRVYDNYDHMYTSLTMRVGDYHYLRFRTHDGEVLLLTPNLISMSTLSMIRL